MTSRRLSWLVAAAITIWPMAGICADLPVDSGKPATSRDGSTLPGSAAPAGSVLASPDSTCLEWTDGCRTCRKSAADEPACSNIGIACQPQALRCLKQPEK